jgi:hypothetical protein
MQTKLIATAALLSTIAAATLVAPASAGERWRYETDKRQAKQHQLIREGRHSGALTWRETFMLRREQVRIARMERAFRSDGHLSWTERQSLRYAQDAATTHIFQERNDHQNRRYWR